MAVSLLGDGIYLVAIAWQVYDLSNTPTALAFVGVATMLPTVLLLLAGGVITDRFERRRVLITADVLRACSVAAIGALAVSGRLELWHVFALVPVFGVGDALFTPAFRAIVPELVPREQLVPANAVEQFARPAVRLVGPAIGGFVVHGLGAGAAFLFDAASFGCSIAALLFLQSRPIVTERPRTLSAALADLREGFQFVRSQTWIWGTLSMVLAGNMVSGVLFVLVPFIVKNQLHESAAGLGGVFSIGAIGAIVASIAVSQLRLPRRHIAFMYLTWSAGSFFVIAYAFVDSLWQAMLVALVLNAGYTAGNVIWETLVGLLVPRELLGRVTSVDWLLSIGLIPVAYAIVGPVAKVVGSDATIIGAGLVSGALPLLYLLFLPGLRDTEKLESLQPVTLAPQAAGDRGTRG